MKVALTALLLLFSQFVSAQEVLIVAEKMNAVYIGLDNPLSIRSCKYPANMLVVSTSQGDIRRLKGDHYQLSGLLRTGMVTIIISRIIAGKMVTIDSAHFRVRTVAPPDANIASKTGGKIAANVLRVQQGLSVGVLSFACCEPRFEVTHFKMSIVKAGTVIKSISTDGYLFTEEMKLQLKHLNPGDEILISSIFAAGAGQRDISLPALDFTVI